MLIICKSENSSKKYSYSPYISMVKKFIFYFEKSDFLVDMEIYRYNHDTVELGDDI